MKRTYLKKNQHLDPPGIPPVWEQCEAMIAKIEARLAEKAINRTENKPVKDGYTMTVDILRRRQTDYAGIETLPTDQARAIAMLAVDYLKGECHELVLSQVPIKR